MANSLQRAEARPGASTRALLGAAISIVALVACAWWASQQQAPDFPTSTRALALIGASVSVYACSLAIRGYRWSLILRAAGIRTRTLDPYGITLVGYMGNTVLPLRGGEALRVLLVRERTGAGWAAAIGSVIPERLLDAATLAILFGAVALTATVETPGGDLPAVIALAALTAAVLAAIGYRGLRRGGRLQALADRIRPLAEASRPLLTRAGLGLGGLSMLIWLSEGVVFWLIGQALRLHIDPAEGLALVVVSSASSLIPAGPGFAGTYDAALLVSLRALGLAGAVAITYMLLVRFVLFVPVTVAGLAVAVIAYGGWGHLRGRRGGGEVAPR